MADRDSVERELREILVARMSDKPDPVSIPADVPIFRSGLGLDSLSGLELLSSIEKRFGVYIDDDNFDVFDSLEKLIDFVAERSEGKEQ